MNWVLGGVVVASNIFLVTFIVVLVTLKKGFFAKRKKKKIKQKTVREKQKKIVKLDAKDIERQYNIVAKYEYVELQKEFICYYAKKKIRRFIKDQVPESLMKMSPHDLSILGMEVFDREIEAEMKRKGFVLFKIEACEGFNHIQFKFLLVNRVYIFAYSLDNDRIFMVRP